ncbi:MAG: ABC transporter ATP-binding protein [Clostridiales bacterium]|jgi:zinc transport system ATP-binding protein|nr:ABC transporter ATP-binding protein [Clostridiales bacterium]
MELISCRKAAFAYDGAVAASELNFTVNEGDYLCVVGENGSGKSTLMNGLLMLKPPQSGEVVLNESLRAGDIGYLPQQSRAQRDFPASVYETVLSGRLSARGLRPFYTREDRRIALENMEKLNITSLKDRCYRELSGGQQQRVLLCRALCATRKLLVMDEPVTGLDPKVTGELYAAIKEINLAGMTIVMVSHDIRSAVAYATHILHINNRQLFFGTASEYAASGVGKAFIANCS